MKSRSSSVRWKALQLLAVALFTACSDERGPLAEGERTAERIIAVAPNIVELLYALDLGDRVVVLETTVGGLLK